MNKNNIIEKYYRDKNLDKLIKNMLYKNGDIKKESFDIVKSEVFYSLLTRPEDFIISLYEDNKLINYITRSLSLQIFSKKSPFHYQRIYDEHPDYIVEYEDEEIEYEDEESKGNELSEYIKSANILTWYELQIFNMYYTNNDLLTKDIKDITYVKIAEILGVTKTLIYKKMKEIKRKMYIYILEEGKYLEFLNAKQINKIKTFIQ